MLPGHWAERRLNHSTIAITSAWACEKPEACLGGLDSKCREGHEGPLCAQCKRGYKFGTDGLCELGDGVRTNASTAVSVTMVVAGSVDDFDEEAFRSKLAEVAGADVSAVSLQVSSASVRVTAVITPSSEAGLAEATTNLQALANKPPEEASDVLGVTIESVDQPAVMALQDGDQLEEASSGEAPIALDGEAVAIDDGRSRGLSAMEAGLR